MMDSGLLSLKWNNHGSTFLNVLSSIRRKGSYTDATVTCEGKFYPVHKFILSTCSEYFEKIFERTQSKDPVIVLMDMKHEELEALLNYMYLGEVNVLQAELAGLVKAAECLKIKGLAVPDEAPSSKIDSTKENKRCASDINSSSVGPLHKIPRQDDDFRSSPSRSSPSYKSHQKESYKEPRASSAQTFSEGDFTSPSRRSPNQPSEGSMERRTTLEANPLENTSNSSQHVQILEDSSLAKKEIEEPNENENDALNSDSSLTYDSVVNLVMIEDTPLVKKEIEEIKEEVEDVLNSDSRLAYESMASESEDVFKGHISAGPRGMDNLVAQSIPGSSSMQGDWAERGGGGDSARNFYHEGFTLEDSSHGRARATQGGGQEMDVEDIEDQPISYNIYEGASKYGGDILIDSKGFEHSLTSGVGKPPRWSCVHKSKHRCPGRYLPGRAIERYEHTCTPKHAPGIRRNVILDAKKRGVNYPDDSCKKIAEESLRAAYDPSDSLLENNGMPTNRQLRDMLSYTRNKNLAPEPVGLNFDLNSHNISDTTPNENMLLLLADPDAPVAE